MHGKSNLPTHAFGLVILLLYFSGLVFNFLKRLRVLAEDCNLLRPGYYNLEGVLKQELIFDKSFGKKKICGPEIHPGQTLIVMGS